MLMNELERFAWQLRIDVIEMLYRAGSGHPGGSLSTAEIFSALFKGGVINYPQEKFESYERDSFVLSKGHGCPTLYATLASMGFFPIEATYNLRKMCGDKYRLQGHPSTATRGIEIATGSLGQGLSVAV